jgi:hypothetical protein
MGVVAAITTLEMVLLLWAAVLAVLVGALALATRRRQSRAGEFGQVAGTAPERREATAPDRRLAGLDRRMGLPDMRPHRVERRAPGGDRRRGVRDRRGMVGPA